MTDRDSLPLLDQEQLDSMTSGDISLSVEVMEIFQQQADIWGRMLDGTLPRQQWADAAHTLKGSSLSIGAMKLANVCEIAERLGRAEEAPSPAAIGVALSDVKTILGQTLEATAKLIYQLENSSGFKAVS